MNSVTSVQEQVNAVSPVHISLDVLLLLVATIFLFGIFYFLGKRRVVTLTFALLLSLLLALIAPFKEIGAIDSFITGNPVWGMLGVLVAFSIFTYLLAAEFISLEDPYSPLRKVLHVGILTLAFEGLLLSVFFTVKILPGLYTFSANTALLFRGESKVFIWVILSAVLLYILSRD